MSTLSGARVLVTGGAGTIGSTIVDQLVEAGVGHVDVLDNLVRGRLGNLEDALASGKVTLVEGDIRDRDLVFRLFAEERFDGVVHLAARAGVRPSLRQPVLYEEVNCVATLHLLEAAVSHGGPRFLFASSSSVYGTNSKLPFSEEDPIARPISPYATTKRAGELHVYATHHLHDLPAACLRFFTVYGPRQRPEMAIARFIRCLETDEPIPFFGDGGSRRDYTYIDDIVDGIESALEADFAFEILNLGSAHPVTLTDLVAELEEATGKRARLARDGDQPGDVPVTFASVEKAERLLGYRPRVPLREGLRRSVEWYRSQRA